jgi:hypothetical protein
MDAILPLIDNGKFAFEANWTPYHPPVITCLPNVTNISGNGKTFPQEYF